MTLAELVAFVQAIPPLVKLLQETIDFIGNSQLEAKMKKVEDLIDRLEKAVTAQEKLGVADSINDAIHHL